MNPAQALYAGEREVLPASDCAALANRLGLLPWEMRDWCGEVADMLQMCPCGVVLVKPETMCPQCAPDALSSRPARASKYYQRKREKKQMENTTTLQCETVGCTNTFERTSSRRKYCDECTTHHPPASYTPELAATMSEQAKAIHEYARTPSRSVARLREMRF